MIFDRTSKDVETALKIREEKVKKSITLTDEEKETMRRGFLTIETINEIEEKERILWYVLREMGYYNIFQRENNKTNWSLRDIFLQSDLRRIVEICNAYRDAFFVLSTTPRKPTAKFHYSDINVLEKNLRDIEIVTEQVKERYKRCGSTVSGG